MANVGCIIVEMVYLRSKWNQMSMSRSSTGSDSCFIPAFTQRSAK